MILQHTFCYEHLEYQHVCQFSIIFPQTNAILPQQDTVQCCSVLQRVAVCCSVVQCVAVWCSVLQCVAVCCSVLLYNISAILPQQGVQRRYYTTPYLCRRALYIGHTFYIMTHCNTLQHTATHCNTLQHTATHCNTLQHTAAHRNTPQHTATHSRARL